MLTHDSKDDARPLYLAPPQEPEEEYSHYMLDVMGGGYAEFSGEMAATGVDNYLGVFRNNGTLE